MPRYLVELERYVRDIEVASVVVEADDATAAEAQALALADRLDECGQLYWKNFVDDTGPMSVSSIDPTPPAEALTKDVNDAE